MVQKQYGSTWNYFVTSENLETIEPDVIQNYIANLPLHRECRKLRRETSGNGLDGRS